MKNILVLQHEAHEGLGAWDPLFKTAARKVVTQKLFAGDKVPLDESLCAYDGIVILGGSMSANDEHLDFIRDELVMIAQAIELKIPLLGVCLGAQLIARALGSKITPLLQKEIGWSPIHLGISCGKDNLFGGLSGPVMMFQWHGETFQIPSGAIHLAKTDLCPHQAFRYADRIYGLQFHCEMTHSMISDWVEKGRSEIEAAGLSPEAILEKTPKYLPTLRHWATQIAQKWLMLK